MDDRFRNSLRHISLLGGLLQLIPITFSFILKVGASRVDQSLLLNEASFCILNFFFAFLNDVLCLLEEELVDDDCNNSANPWEYEVDPSPCHSTVLNAFAGLKNDSHYHAKGNRWVKGRNDHHRCNGREANVHRDNVATRNDHGGDSGVVRELVTLLCLSQVDKNKKETS